MKRSLFLLPLGLAFAASVVHAEPIQIPLQPTPLNPNSMSSSGGGATVNPTAPVAKKKAAEYTDAELRLMGTGVAFPYELLDSVLHRFVSAKGQMYYLKAKDDNDLATFDA